jgi:hypothetical protein
MQKKNINIIKECYPFTQENVPVKRYYIYSITTRYMYIIKNTITH